MTTGASASVALALQWGLLVGFLSLIAAAALAGAKWPRVRPVAFAVGVLSLAHAVYYALFLVWPDVLAGYATMLLSIGTRWVVLFVSLAVLVIEILRQRWR